MLGTQVVGLVQEAVLGAAKPGLGMGTQVPHVVVTVGLHEVLEGLGDPVGEGSSQLKPQLLPGLCPVDPLLPQPRVPAPSPSCTHSLEPLPVLSGPSRQRLHRPLRCPTSGSGNYLPARQRGSGFLQALLAGILGGTRGNLGGLGPQNPSSSLFLHAHCHRHSWWPRGSPLPVLSPLAFTSL